MGLIKTTLTLRNPRREDINPLEVASVVDTGAMHLCIPEHVFIQLELDANSEREVTIADGKKIVVPYVGPIEIIFENRKCYVGALVLGDEVLLGAVPMEDMDLVVSPAGQTMIVNPKSPNIPTSVVKCFLTGNEQQGKRAQSFN